MDSNGNGGMDIVLVRPTNGATIGDVERHIAAQQGPDGAASTRWLVGHAQIFGGTGIQGKGTHGHQRRAAGRHRLRPGHQRGLLPRKDPTTAPEAGVDTSAGRRTRASCPRISSTISMTSADKFQVTSTHLGSGRYLIRNASDTMHFAVFQPVKPGTTDADMTKVANAEANGQPPAPTPYLRTSRA